MTFDLQKSIEILRNTPATLSALLSNLSSEWTDNHEGEGSWSPYDIVGHLIHGEKTDWIVRLEIIMSDSDQKRFEPFDRFAQFEESKGKTLAQLLEEFSELRRQNLEKLIANNINVSDLEKTGTHPAFGSVTLRQLLATWVVHDLNHIYQVSRVMAFQYKGEVGPWIQYLRVLNG